MAFASTKSSGYPKLLNVGRAIIKYTYTNGGGDTGGAITTPFVS